MSHDHLPANGAALHHAFLKAPNRPRSNLAPLQSRCNAILIALVGALAALSTVEGAEDPVSTPDWAAKLPTNQWFMVDEQQSGNRINAQVVWLENEKKLVISGGNERDSRRESRKPNKMLFDPTTGQWTEYKGEPALPSLTLALADSSKRLSVTVALPAEFKAQAGARTTVNSPLDGESSIFLDRAHYGGQTFLDPSNGEAWLVGGSAPGFAAGYIGNWIYSLEANKWRPSAAGTAGGRALVVGLKDLASAQKDLVAKARNLFYAAPTTEADAVRSQLSARQEDLRKRIEAASVGLVAQGVKEGLAADSVEVARGLIGTATELVTTAARGFTAGTIDAALLKGAEDAAWRLDEAADAIAVEPTPRRGASGVFDPAGKQYILFGGDHGDYLLNDTWIFDCASRKWRRMWPKLAPSGRSDAQAFWLPEARQMVIIAGSGYPNRMIYQRLGEKLAPDVWLYDPASNQWRFLVRPGEEVLKKLSRDGMPVFRINNPMALTGNGVLICPAVGGNDYADFMVSSTWMLRVDPAAADPALTAQHGVPTGTRLYRSQRVEAYNPQWYDAAPRGQPKEIEALLAGMPANQWVNVPLSPRPAPERAWGTCLYDPDRDQILFWTGGHCADPADIVHHYHPGINRWSLPYVAGGGAHGNQLTGRPDCSNHTYHNYAFDAVSRKMVAVHRAGTHVYDLDRREWTGFTPNQLFPYNLYSSKCVSTPRGVVAWAGGCGEVPKTSVHFQIFDVKAMKWTPLPVKGKAVPQNVHGDEGGMVWDSKRSRLYIFAASNYQKPNGQVHRYDFESGELAALDPGGMDTIGGKFYKYRETVYLPELDLVLFGMGWIDAKGKGKQVAYDPGKNRWVVLDITRTAVDATYDAGKGQWNFAAPKANEGVGSMTFSPVLDTKRNVLWTPSDYKAMFVMKLDAKTLVISEDPTK